MFGGTIRSIHAIARPNTFRAVRSPDRIPSAIRRRTIEAGARLESAPVFSVLTHNAFFEYDSFDDQISYPVLYRLYTARISLNASMTNPNDIDVMIEGTPSVRIKGVGNCLWVTITPDAPFELIRADLERLFAPLNLSRTTRVVLDTGNGPDDDGRRGRISTYLKASFDLNEVLAPQDNNRIEEKRYRMKDSRSKISQVSSDTLVVAGRVRSGQSVHARKHLIIMGDVNPGCELMAGGDILVLGSLCGTAAAGQPDNTEAVILALDFRPLQVKIGPIVAAGRAAPGNGAPEIAHVEDGAIVVDDYLAASPFKRVAWPAIR